MGALGVKFWVRFHEVITKLLFETWGYRLVMTVVKIHFYSWYKTPFSCGSNEVTLVVEEEVN